LKESLIDTIKKIAQILRNHIKPKALDAILLDNKALTGNDFREHPRDPEPFTRRHIVEPILKALGYDISPDDLIDEAHQKAGRRYSKKADYTLIISDDVYVLVEVEPLNKNLEAKGSGVHQVEQWLQLRTAITDYGIATNGFEWRLLKYDENSGRLKEIERVNIKPIIRRFVGIHTLHSDAECNEIIEKFCTVFSRDTIVTYLEEKFLVLEEMKEEITNKFYKQYIELVFGVSEEGKPVRTKYLVNSIIAPHDATEKEKRLFAITLMNRLFFIKFLEEKGLVRRDLLRYLKMKYSKEKLPSTFYKSYIEPLFFEVFNKPISERRPTLPPEFKKIPYLNGGLFREVVRNERSYDVDDDIFMEIIDFLESYRFLLDESAKGNDVENFESEKGELNPDILGNIFEKTINFISGPGSNEQKAKGAYYTPEPIVRYIVKNTIDRVLYNKIIDAFKSAGWRESDLRTYRDLQSIFDNPPRSRKDLELILRCVESLKILDPACGSGHFLTGALKELLRIYLTIYDLIYESSNSTRRSIDLYELKKKIILNNIYGVDIDEHAVEIAKLRLWLSLIEEVDIFDPTQIKELPNIEYNIRCGNSLIGLTSIKFVADKHGGSRLVDEGILQKIEEYKSKIDEYVERNDLSLKEEIEALREELQQILDEVYANSLNVTIEDVVSIKELESIINEKLNVSAINLLFRGKVNKKSEVAKILGSHGFNIYSKKAKIHESRLKYADKAKLLNAISAVQSYIEKIVVERRLGLSDLKELKSFHWILEFSDVILNKGGFDIVVGNPPHGAKISDIEKEIWLKLYKLTERGVDSAKVFFERSIQLLKKGGVLAFVIPKPATYSYSWEDLRRYILGESDEEKNNKCGLHLSHCIDLGKAFANVKHEQVAVIVWKCELVPEYYICGYYDKSEYRIIEAGKITHDFPRKFGILASNLISEEIEIANYIYSQNFRRMDEFDVFRGLPRKFRSNKGEKCLKGKDIGRYFIRSPQEFVNTAAVDENQIMKLRREKIIAQRIIAHVIKPFDHIIIMAYPDTIGYLTFETVTNIIPKDDDSIKSLTLLLNSRLVCWIVYSLIYNKAIRDMDFDGYFVKRIPLPSYEEHTKYLDILCDYLLFLNVDEDTRQLYDEIIDFIDRALVDSIVYELYFRQKFIEDSKKAIEKGKEPIYPQLERGPFLIDLIAKYLKPIDYNNYAKLVYSIKSLNEEDKQKIKEMKKNYLKTIKEVVEAIKADEEIMKLIRRIKQHRWVKVIEGEG